MGLGIGRHGHQIFHLHPCVCVPHKGRKRRGSRGTHVFIEAGLGRPFRILSILFFVCGLVGCLSLFQANQLAEVLESSYGLGQGWTAVICMLTVGGVIIAGFNALEKSRAASCPS